MAAENLQLSTAVGTGDVLRSLFDSDGVEYVAGLCAYPTTTGTPSASTISIVDLTHGLPVQQQTGATFAVTGTFWQATQPVSIASTLTVTGTGGTFPVTDSGGSLTVDAPVGTPVFVRLSDGSSAITTLPVSAASLPLPSGAATSALQTAGNADINIIAGATPADLSGNTSRVAAVGGYYALGGSGAGFYSINASDTTPASGAVGLIVRNIPSGTQTVSGTVAVSGTVTVGSHAVTNAGTFVVQENGAALTALQLIDNLVLAEDAAHVSGDPGVQSLAVRKDTAAALGQTDGDYQPLITDSTGRLWCNVSNTLTVSSHDVTNAGTFAVQAAQSGTWNITNVSGTVSLPTGAATAAKQPALGTAGTASADVITVQGIASMTALKVDGSAVTQPVSGTVTATIAAGASTIAKAEDAASADGDVGVPAMAVRKATPANTSGLDGDYEMLQMSAGRLWTSATIDASLPAGTNGIGKLTSNSGVTIGAVEIAAAQTLATVTTVGTVSAVTGGGTAHDGAAGSINPLLVGAYASAAVPTDVSADADAVRLWALRSGALATQPTFAGVLAVAGNGASGTGVQRVTIANDSTGILAGVTTVTTVTTCSTVTTLTGGGVAHDGIDSGNPVKIGARAAATLSDDTMVANADRTDVVSDLDGAIITRGQFPLGDLLSERVSNTDGASTGFSTFGATASARNVITAVVIFNSSATAGYVDFRDGTAGSILYTVPIPAGGGVVLPAGATPYFKTTANTALAFDVSAALSTVYISVSGFKSKVT